MSDQSQDHTDDPSSDSQPIGQFDHIGIAVHSIDAARPFFEGVLGAKFRVKSDMGSGDFRIGIFDLGNFCIELLEPIDPNGFVAKFLEKRGEGVHHITLQTPELEKKVLAMEENGVRVVDQTDVDAFISPKSSHGVLIQLGQALGPLNNEPYWEKD